MHHTTTCRRKFADDPYGSHLSKTTLFLINQSMFANHFLNTSKTGIQIIISSRFFTNVRLPVERNVNGQKGELNSRKATEKQQQEPEEAAAPSARNPHVPGSRPSVRPNAMRNREKQLIALKQMEERIQRLKV